MRPRTETKASITYLNSIVDECPAGQIFRRIRPIVSVKAGELSFYSGGLVVHVCCEIHASLQRTDRSGQSKYRCKMHVLDKKRVLTSALLIYRRVGPVQGGERG